MEEKVQKKRTRPRIQIDLEKVEQLAQVCDNEEEIALALGISYRTLRNRKKDFANFATAIKKGKAKANAFVGGKLTVLKAIQLVEFGHVDPSVTFKFNELGEADAAATAITAKF